MINMSYLDITCPKCGNSYFTIRYSTSTAMWSPTIIKDGKVISSNPNYETHHCQCIACGAFFDATEHNGVIESIEVINGFAAPSQLPYETISVDAEELERSVSESAKQWALAADQMNVKGIATLKKEIAELQTTLQPYSMEQITYGNYKSSPNPCGE